ncbi:hypothetical protein HO173_009641 [Letharia columbiana]|uniref:Uncharacterized protein n=1 Tax=Letharia columbiana TaxID=112416 RepID=A0A8H6FPD9_9LECA|nr:uncharacterized protein HO173_009641 [Letharia columbiana]KAF6232258.1 hypothetical protein HO173_009641 [Letharia columbiana]
MARQHAARPEKRHLVRWNDEMDKKLLLAMQYQCNLAGLAVPWTGIGSIMGEGITGGAVIQHLAKLRIRMVTQGLSVPPPLRRGGGSSRISTSASSGSKAKATPTKNGNAQPIPNSTKSTPAKPKMAGKKAAPGSDESEEEEGSWNIEDSDEEYGKPRAKRAKSDTKGPMRRKMKTEDSDEEEDTPPRAPKRKHQSSKSSSRDLSAYGTTDINGKPIDDYSDVEDDTKDDIVAAGAPWLALEDDYVSHPETGKKTPYKKNSLVVSLPTTPYKTSAVGAIKKEDTGDMSDDEIDEGSDDEVVGGRVENYADGSRVFSNQDMDHEFSNSPYNQSFEDLAAAQMEPASGTTNHIGMYNNLYHGRPQVMPSNGDSYQGRQAFVDAYNNDYNDPSVFQASAGMFENDGLGQTQGMEQSEGFGSSDGGNFALDQISTNFNPQSAGGFGDMNSGFIGAFDNNGGVDTDSFGNGAMSNGIVQPDAFAYQTGNGYGASSNASFGNRVGGLHLSNGHSHSQNIPYAIQTSWPSNYSSAGASNGTSVNQTPAGTSAGVDVGTGYFSNGHFDLGSFDDTSTDFSANDGAAGLFNVGHFDGNFVGDGIFGNDPYGN